MQSMSAMTTISTFALMGATALGAATPLALGACGPKFEGCDPTECGDGGTAGMGGGTGGTAGGGGQAGGVIPGSQYIPTITHPDQSSLLSPTRAYLHWQPGTVPNGKTLDGYEVCYVEADLSKIDDPDECPNGQSVSSAFTVIEPLVANSSYHLKIGALYGDGWRSEFSGVRTFSTGALPAGWWPLDGDLSDSVGANDGSPQNNPGYASGINGQGILLDGISQYADIANDGSLDLPGALTLSAWIYGDGIPMSSDSGIVSMGALNYALTYHTNGNVYFYIGDGGNSLSAPVEPDSWHHVVGTFDGTTNADGMKLYVDGALAASRASLVDTANAAGSLWFGRYDTSYFKGTIDDVMIHSAALSDQMIANEHCAIRALAGEDPLLLTTCD